MKAVHFFVFALLGLLLSGCASQADFPRLDEKHVSSEERRILVTFEDRTIKRDVPSSAVDQYRMHGRYDNSVWSTRVAEQFANRYQLKLVAQWPVTALGVACVVYEIPAQQPVNELLEKLAKDTDVGSAQLMRTFRAAQRPKAPSQGYTDPYFSLQSGFQAMQVAAAHRLATGRGVRVAVVDTGVDTGHPDLEGQVAMSENLGPEPSDGNLADRHGTAVAGVLAARADNGVGIVGIAPGAEVIALRACWPERPGAAEAQCNSFTLALALNEAMRLDAKIVNLSLTGPDDPLVGKLIEAAIAKGIILIAAEASPGETARFPANVPGVIGVRSASLDKAQPAGFLAAPGTDVLTTVPRGAYDFLSGSSFAAPHIAGLTALLLEARPDLSGVEIAALLKAQMARKGSSAINACVLLAELKGSTAAISCPAGTEAQPTTIGRKL